MLLSLQKQLVLWVGSALLLALIGLRVVAQVEYEEYAPPATTREAVSLFDRLVQRSPSNGEPSADNYLGYRLISNASQQQLGWRATFALLEELEKHRRLDIETSAPRQENGRVVVNTKPKSYPTVFVAEAGGYRVDLVATYAKRLGLETPALQKDIYLKSGVALDGLPGKDTPQMQDAICQSNLRELALAVAQYTQDYDERMPSAKSWSDVLKPYGPREAMYSCPTLSKSKSYGYAYNSKMSLKPYAIWSKGDATILFYETTILRLSAHGIGGNSAFRHRGGANYAFVDGHVKWFSKGNAPTFALKQ